MLSEKKSISKGYLLGDSHDITSIKDKSAEMENGLWLPGVRVRGQWEDVIVKEENEEFLFGEGTVNCGGSYTD